MVFPAITHRGATQGVTGSCHQLHLNVAHSLLIHCGLFQGDKPSPAASLEVDFPVEGIEALLISHVHIDHVGCIP